MLWKFFKDQDEQDNNKTKAVMPRYFRVFNSCQVERGDAIAIEASLSENITRLPMDEIDQFKAFAALTREGHTIEEIAHNFDVREQLVK